MRYKIKDILDDITHVVGKGISKSYISKTSGHDASYLYTAINRNASIDEQTYETIIDFKRKSTDAQYYVEIDEDIRNKIREAYSYYPSYRGVCNNVLGFTGTNSATFHKLINGEKKTISKHRIEKLEMFLEQERKNSI